MVPMYDGEVDGINALKHATRYIVTNHNQKRSQECRTTAPLQRAIGIAQACTVQYDWPSEKSSSLRL